MQDMTPADTGPGDGPREDTLEPREASGRPRPQWGDDRTARRANPRPPSPEGGPQGVPEAVQQGMRQGMRQAIEGVAREERSPALSLRYGYLWLVGYALILLAVVVLALAAHAFSVLPGDLTIERELQENRNHVVFAAMYIVSWFGYEPQALLIYVFCVVGLWLVRLRLESLFLALTAIADGIGDLVKLLVARSRPSATLVDVVAHLNSYSFPSGHTVHYTVFYGFLAFVIATRFRIHWLRQALLAICIALIALVGLSRVYLGEHWPTDVVGGYLIAGLFLVPFIAAYLWAEAHLVVVDYWPFIERRAAAIAPEAA